MGDIKVVVTRPGPKVIIVVDEENRLLLFMETYNKRVEPGIYTEPEDIVEIFKQLATRGHNTSWYHKSPDVILSVLRQILYSDIPFEDKRRELLRYLRAK